MSIQQQIENHLPITIDSGDFPTFIGWINEAQKLLVYLVEETDAQKYVQTFAVSTDGLETDTLRFIQAFKGDKPAGMYPSHAYQGLINGNYDGFYRATENFPAAVFNNGKIFIFPAGGHVSAFGVKKLQALSEESIEGMPPSFQVACVIYSAIQWHRSKINEINNDRDNAPTATPVNISISFPQLQRETFSESLASLVFPSDPSLPNVNVDNVSAENIDAPTITSPSFSGNEYDKVNPQVDFQKAINRETGDDIEMLNGEVNRLATEIQALSTKMTDELNRVQTLITGYQSQVQHSLEQGRLTMNATEGDARLKLEAAVTNATNNLNNQLEQRNQLIGKYQAQISKAAQQSQDIIARYRAKLEQWAKESDLNVAEFSQHVQFLLTKYQTDVQSELTHFQNELSQVAMDNQTRDSKIQTHLTQVQQLSDTYAQAVQNYIMGLRKETYMPAPIDPEVPA